MRKKLLTILLLVIFMLEVTGCNSNNNITIGEVSDVKIDNVDCFIRYLMIIRDKDTLSFMVRIYRIIEFRI